LRFYSVSDPATLVFDETYYAKDGCLYAGLGQEACDSPGATEQSYVHPPVAKWIIAAGIRAFGYNSFGWRFSAVLFGTATVALVFLLARKLFLDRWIAAVAGLLAAIDFLLIVQSRIAMLDIFLTFFVVLGFLLLAHDRERVLRLRDHLLRPSTSEAPRREPEWRYAAGAVFGLAVASKWSGAYALFIGLLMALAWSAALFRDARRE
jgi:dolichyl-phosphate-mannose-protein mannosyltransferase